MIRVAQGEAIEDKLGRPVGVDCLRPAGCRETTGIRNRRKVHQDSTVIPKRQKKPDKFAGFAFPAVKKARRGEDKTRLKKELDDLFSEYIRRRDGRCQFCLKVNDYKKLSAHHIWSRTSMAGRWAPANGLALCFSCHRNIAHQKYEVFRRWLIGRVGEEAFEKLMILCESKVKFRSADLQLIKKDLQDKIRGLK